MASDMPKLAPGATRKRNVFDVIEALQKQSAKTILVRVDFNVPMNSDGKITDDSRIRGALPTIKAVVNAKCNAVLVSHMGRPKLVQKAADDEETRQQRHELSLKPVADHLAKLLDQEVLFGDDCLHAQSTIRELPAEGGGVCLLENLRFYKEEEKNGEDFRKTLASYADGYVNDAFGTSHRAHASVAGVPALLPKEVCGIGCLVASELAYLDFKNASSDEQIAAIIGGSKVSTKLPVIEGLLKNVQTLVLQGGLAFTFLKAQGIKIGDSLVEDSMIDTAKDLLKQADSMGKTIILPVDAVCSQSFPKGPMDKADTKTFELNTDAGIDDGWMGLDIGPKSVKIIADGLAKATKIVVNGPAGVFEVPPFDEGTRGLVDAIESLTKNGTVSVVGGGDSVAALEAFGKTEAVSYVSTGGGATLELLAGDILPGVAAIADYD
jgi:phosphoglycerate kinase|uniref:Phosphoglycerate kinase n=1 Tax=Phaeodactylum tricornutum TaxID=2850 RepID=A0A8J9S5R0_PHATR